MRTPDVLRYLTVRGTGIDAAPDEIRTVLDDPLIDQTPPVEKQISIPNPVHPEDTVYRSGRREAANRRRILGNNKPRGGRSPQNHGKR